MAFPYVTCRLDDTSRVQSLERRVLIVPIPNISTRFPVFPELHVHIVRIVTYQQTDPAVVSLFCSEIQRQTGALKD